MSETRESVLTEIARRLSGMVIVSADIREEDVAGADIESLVGHILDFYKESQKPNVLGKDALAEIKLSIQQQLPKQVEVTSAPGYKPYSMDYKSSYSIRKTRHMPTGATVADFAEHFNDRLAKMERIISEGHAGSMSNRVKKIENVKHYADGREVTIVGMVYSVSTTKNGNKMITIEDETGYAKVIVSNYNTGKQERPGGLAEEAERIAPDEVIGISGKVSGPFIIAKSIIWPDVPVRTRPVTKDDLAIAFLSDIHVGSKLFLEKQFRRFLEWINGNIDYRKELASKIKYIVVSGDVVDGIGVYPNQDKELAILDIYKQYDLLFELLSEIPEYVEVFVLPGNHDAVQRAEPQPSLPSEFTSKIKGSNIHLLPNPGYVRIENLNVLAYHGTSLDSVIQAVKGCSYAEPARAMEEVLRARHLSPIYGGNPIVPTKEDNLVMDEVPDILHMGHLHKNGYSEYHGTLIVNSGTWQARTSFQARMGHIPTPALLPIYETLTRNLVAIDFNEALA